MRHTFRYIVEADLAEGAEVALSAGDSHHLRRVVRRGKGDAIELIDAAGAIWPAVVTRAEGEVVVRVTAAAPRAPRPARVSLYQGLIEWGRLDTVVEKAVELGAGEVVVIASERARRVPADDAWARRRERLDRVAAAAARQCGRAPMPPVRGLVPFGRVPGEIPDGEGFLIDPRGDVALTSAIGARTAPADRMALVVGPEAGFSDAEVEAARRGGLTVCHMGATILRAETAAIAGVALAASAGWGEDG